MNSDDDELLRETPLTRFDGVIPDRVTEFAEEGRRRAKLIHCFDFVPSSFVELYQVLGALPRSRFCEWGSGIGIGVGIATMLGFEAVGIELNSELAAASRELLNEYGLDATIHAGSYFDIEIAADLYFVYCWPGQITKVESLFVERTPLGSRLLICHGADEIRCKVRIN